MPVHICLAPPSTPIHLPHPTYSIRQRGTDARSAHSWTCSLTDTDASASSSLASGPKEKRGISWKESVWSCWKESVLSYRKRGLLSWEGDVWSYRKRVTSWEGGVWSYRKRGICWEGRVVFSCLYMLSASSSLASGPEEERGVSWKGSVWSYKKRGINWEWSKLGAECRV